MKFTYDGTTYTGSREQIIESLKNDLENKKIFKLLNYPDRKCFRLGQEECLLSICSFSNIDAIRKRLINEALDKVPENYFKYYGQVYYGSKEQILKNIEKDLRSNFSVKGNTYYVGEEICIYVHNLPMNLVLLHEELIAQALKRLENEI